MPTNRMKMFMTAAMAFIALIVAVPAHAQSTGASLLHEIGDNMTSHPEYTAVVGTNTVLIKDVTTGATLFVVKETNAQTITLSSVVATVHSLTPDSRARLLRRISQFNFSSPVGTLWYDNASGNVTMEHHLNPRMVSQSGIMNVAVRFGDAVRAQQIALLQ
ncbi:MAG: hypothetical protein JST22_13480 [Bacteroidetes bacterium]|nr:hypothetical protein [Bacteroidota bacterium]